VKKEKKEQNSANTHTYGLTGKERKKTD